MQFEHKLTKYEVDNHCVLLRDDTKADHSKAFGGHNKLTVKAENGKLYPAEINEYYLDGKFQAGIHFDGGKSNSFFVEQGFFLGHLVTVSVDGSAALVEGRLPIDISFKILTR